MADLYNVAGSTFWIGGVITVPMNRDMTVADFASQDWKEVSGWQTMGSFGDTAQATTTTLIASGRDRKTKGSKNAGTMENVFAPDEADPGQISMLEAAAGCDNYAFRVIFSAGCQRSGAVTISVADPAVITWPGHGLSVNSSVMFETDGTLPAGLTAGVAYYVVEATEGSFSVAETPGGAPVETTAAGTGQATALGTPAGRSRMFGALVMGNAEQGGDANAAQLFSSTLEINSNIVKV